MIVSSFSVPVYYAGLLQPWDFGDNSVEMEIRVFTVDEPTTIDWMPLQESLRPPSINAETWAPIFTKIRAAVTDIGGVMSHAAIVCREYGLPAVVGTGRATARIRSGQRLRVDGSAGTVTIVDG